MSKKYKVPDYIRIVKAVCIEFGNNDDIWMCAIPMCVRH